MRNTSGMKAFAAAVVLFLLCAGLASAGLQSHASLRVLKLTPPIFRGSGFGSHERVTITLRGVRARPVHVRTDAEGRFRVRLAALPSCRAWTVRALGVQGGIAVYHHARCAASNADVEGVVRRSPTKNICLEGDPCSAPDPGVTVQAFRAGNLVAETTTDGHGRFSFSLADGSYTVWPSAVAPSRRRSTSRRRESSISPSWSIQESADAQYATAPRPVAAACFCSSAR